ncbi:MAG: hypothetical protein CMB80_17835, partial [Flammeovirgaceae bacterium]|nr:hypothetical protein [Flammeovirgaceae bacterium]
MDIVIRSTIFIQLRLRYLLIYIRQINTRLDFLYKVFNEIIQEVQYLYLQDVIQRTLYNTCMHNISTIFTHFKTIPRPLRLNDLREMKLYQLKDILYKICVDLYHFTRKYGCVSIRTIVILYTLYRKRSIAIHEFQYQNDQKMSLFYEKNFKIKQYSIVAYSDCLCFHDDESTDLPYEVKILRDVTKPLCRENRAMKHTIIEEINGAILYYPVYSSCKINYFIVATGFFLYDTLNIARLGGHFEQKNIQLESAIKNINIDDAFKLGFITQLSQKEFIIWDVNEIVNHCINAFNDYLGLKELPISILITKFLKSNIVAKREILTLFLLMKDDIGSQYSSYLLYDIVTNNSFMIKKNNVSDILFHSLHWSIQKLLKIAIKKSNAYTKHLANFKEDDITYEKRICLLKAPENVKKKAMTKYKEISKNNDSSAKVKHYLDGILRIPFGIHKKERVIAFLKEYIIKIKNNVANSKKTLLSLIDKISRAESNLTHSTQLTQIKHLNDILKLFDSFEGKNPIISSDINLFLEKIKIKVDLTLEKDVQKDINKKHFDKSYIIQICKSLKVTQLKVVIKAIGSKELVLHGNKKKNEIIKILSHFLSKDKNQHYIKKHSVLLGINDRKTVKQRYKISKNKKYRKFCQRLLSLCNEWDSYKFEYKKYLREVRGCLDKAVYGQQGAKQKIVQIIGQWINGDMKGYCFGFEGPPGTGKTSLAKNGISKCLIDEHGNPRPFSFIALGGTSNGSTLEGHNYTYVGSSWGRIVDVLMDVKCMNPIIFIDELDKVSRTEHGREIIGILTHLTDPTQNDQFADKYFSGIDLDLSRVLFIFSYNNFGLLDPILADRIHRVKFKRLS